MVAEYFEVNMTSISAVVNAAREELEQDGFGHKPYSWWQECYLGYHELDTFGTYRFPGFTFTTKVPGSGRLVFTKQSVLRIAMMLKGSAVAKQIRDVLMDSANNAKNETDSKPSSFETQGYEVVNFSSKRVQEKQKSESLHEDNPVFTMILQYKNKMDQLTEQNNILTASNNNLQTVIGKLMDELDSIKEFAYREIG